MPRRVVACNHPPVLNDGWVYCDRVPPDQSARVPPDPSARVSADPSARIPPDQSARLTPDPSVSLSTVLDYYTHHYRHSDRATWQHRIESGQIRLNDHPTQADTPLIPGQRLTYHRPPWQEPPVPLSIATLYEDDELLVVNKPSGLPVLPGGNFLQNTLLWQLRQHHPTAAPIHRLGRGTSGIMLIAKTKAARAHLSQQMRQRHLGKTYRALIGPAAALADQFTINHPIGKIPYPQLGHIYGATPNGLEAHSDCTVVQRHTHATLLDVTILTGRPHQIRIHLAAMGYPLLGDPLYVIGGQPHGAATAIPSDCGYWLHAHRLSFRHPAGERMTLLAAPPVELMPS
ncbi:RluA family pseudouridine synthase [Leptothoe sp. PORK10 BA2]|uniref:RluA family pseudouridine synthase n=1 Tax=Leptothoe sp. PORK10 BA2 TaxID=3110254 RepID=UPI002B211BB4|nr:RluA family pseudouridine synthase [Leptothoe sp. PORK10 BA2]MEA5465212.1 RluA family pseudouridine synthase [Leptothoe sp. PORK10 BA2]